MRKPLKEYITQFKQDVKCEWFAWLKTFEWNCWATFTFRKGIFDEMKALDMFEKFWHPRCIGYFAVAERFKFNPSVHIHALLMYQGCRKKAWAEWLHRFGRNRIEPIWEIPNLSDELKYAGVASYCSKYITKDMADYRFYYIDKEKNLFENSKNI